MTDASKTIHLMKQRDGILAGIYIACRARGWKHGIDSRDYDKVTCRRCIKTLPAFVADRLLKKLKKRK